MLANMVESGWAVARRDNATEPQQRLRCQLLHRVAAAFRDVGVETIQTPLGVFCMENH